MLKTLLLLILLASTRAYASYAVVITSATGDTAGQPSMNTTGSDLLVMQVVCTNNGFPPAPSSWTDSKGNTWVQAAATGFSESLIAYVANPVVGSGHSVTVFSGTHGCTAVFTGFSGSALTSPLDQTASSSGTGLTATTSLTPLSANELVVGICNGTGYTISSTTGLATTDVSINTPGINGNQGTILSAHTIQTTATAVTFTVNLSGTPGTAQQSMVLVSFKAAGAGPTAAKHRGAISGGL